MLYKSVVQRGIHYTDMLAWCRSALAVEMSAIISETVWEPRRESDEITKKVEVGKDQETFIKRLK